MTTRKRKESSIIVAAAAAVGFFAAASALGWTNPAGVNPSGAGGLQIVSGRIGLGTALPGSTLSVASSTAIGATYAGMVVGQGSLAVEGAVGFGLAQPIPLGAGGGNRLSVAGGVAIGATYGTLAAPASGLIVEGKIGVGTTSLSAAIPGRNLLVDGGGFSVNGIPQAGIPNVRVPVANSFAAISGTGTEYISLAVGVDGLPRITATNAVTGLWLITCGNTSCSSGNTLKNFSGTAGATYTALGLRPSTGNPMIAYYDGKLRGILCGDPLCAAFATSDIDTTFGEDVGSFVSFATAGATTTFAYYRGGAFGDLVMTACSGWTTAPCATGTKVRTVVESSNNVGQYASMVLGYDGLPIIAYYDATNGDLRFVQCTKGDCSTHGASVLLDSGAGLDAGRYASLAIGTDGLPIVAYYIGGGGSGSLKILRCSTAGCTGGVSTNIVDGVGDAGYYASIAMGSNGFPMFAYQAASPFDLRFGRCGDSACSVALVATTTLDSDAIVGTHANVAIGAEGLPIVAYRNLGSELLMFRRCGSEFCMSNWTRR
jgi:hypothetical protein